MSDLLWLGGYTAAAVAATAPDVTRAARPQLLALMCASTAVERWALESLLNGGAVAMRLTQRLTAMAAMMGFPRVVGGGALLGGTQGAIVGTAECTSRWLADALSADGAKRAVRAVTAASAVAVLAVAARAHRARRAHGERQAAAALRDAVEAAMGRLEPRLCEALRTELLRLLAPAQLQQGALQVQQGAAPLRLLPRGAQRAQQRVQQRVLAERAREASPPPQGRWPAAIQGAGEEEDAAAASEQQQHEDSEGGQPAGALLAIALPPEGVASPAVGGRGRSAAQQQQQPVQQLAAQEVSAANTPARSLRAGATRRSIDPVRGGGPVESSQGGRNASRRSAERVEPVGGMGNVGGARPSSPLPRRRVTQATAAAVTDGSAQSKQRGRSAERRGKALMEEDEEVEAATSKRAKRSAGH